MGQSTDYPPRVASLDLQKCGFDGADTQGYPSTSQRVFLLKECGYLFLHFPYSMHYVLKKFGPHGPCTMYEVIVSYASGWRVGSGISTDTIES